MPDTKTIVSKRTLVVPCPDKSKKDKEGQFTVVEMKPIAPGEHLVLDAAEADDLVARGHATFAKIDTVEEPESKGRKAA